MKNFIVSDLSEPIAPLQAADTMVVPVVAVLLIIAIGVQAACCGGPPRN